MTIDKEEEIRDWEEYSFEGEHPEKCEMICDHDIHWCGQQYACNNCGLRFIPAKWANSELHSLQQEMVEKIEEMKHKINCECGCGGCNKGTGNCGNCDYNSALADVLKIISGNKE